MGNANSSSEKEQNKSPSLTESHNSARNVLEKIGLETKGDIKGKANKYEDKLKGKLSEAKFYHPLFLRLDVKKDVPNNPCELNYIFHTNVRNAKSEDRCPCLLRDKERFSNESEAECNGGIITGNKGGCGACAPYRRRHMCDYNLEHLNDRNVLNTHDLLGNVLVMAKSEGESIVNNHPNRGSSEVCTALARSFADIGDIIRGKDLFLGHKMEKISLENNLKKIFKNIYDNLNVEAKTHYKDPEGNYYKLREDWWALNRQDVWKALSCYAQNNEEYFIHSEGGIKFSERKCGHDENKVLTNLDYVPQFLRWFDEWAEGFCRIRKYKLEKVKDACRNDSEKLYCSHNGYDCTQTVRRKDILHRDSNCTGCLVKCSLYDSWLRNQRNEFEKQKEKYEKEIKTYTSKKNKPGSNINNEYYKQFYDKLKKNYESVDKFLKLLNEGKYCKEQVEEKISLDFNSSVDKTFSHSKHCKVCPYCGVVCKNGTCTAKKEIYPNCENNEAYSPDDAKTTEINVIVSGDKEGYIFEKLEDFCTKGIKSNGQNYEKWQCYYKDEKQNKCKMEINGADSKLNNKITSFDGFFDFWVRNILRDSIKWENELKNCINNTNVTDCNNKCNRNCVCFDKWVKQKEDEWKNMMKLFENEQNIPKKYKINISKLFDSYFFQVMNELNKDEAKWNELKQKLEEKIDSSNIINGKENSQDVIKVLFDHLKEKSTICKDNNTNEACDSSKTLTQNPCGNNTKNGGDKVINVKKIAQYYKRKAYAQLEERGGGRSALKGDASKGTYSRNGKPSELTNVCSIKEKHSNAHSKSEKPCHGKDGTGQRFIIGTDWKDDKFISTTHKDVYMPPRRQHFCTSNLEYLINGGHQAILRVQNGKINNSFLGDVLLAAKSEAEYIKKNYEDNNNKEGICRAIRYSFADLGDIIKGTDLWDKNHGEINTQKNLVEIFSKIKENLPKPTKTKYTKSSSPYLDLRSDWWEANRDQVWNAMKCHMEDLKNTSSQGKASSHCGYSDHTPLDDYIPQRLRWMTEWAEWYCKAQKKAYEELEKQCKTCKGKGDGKNCYKKTTECNDCKEACDKYKGEINKWKQQWDKIRAKYETLYSKAKTDAFNGGPRYSTDKVQKEDQSVYDFLYDLHLQNGGILGPPPDAFRTGSSSVETRNKRAATSNNTQYDNIGGYLHDTGNFDDCVEQKEFCDKKNGDKKNTNYAFEETPQVYKDACVCEKRTEEQVKKKDDEICNTVKELIRTNDGTTAIGGCNPKNYNSWNCDPSKFVNGNSGACMPPRRQSLCVSDLTVLTTESSESDLKSAFINCAAKEIHFAWKKFKDDKKKKNPNEGKAQDADELQKKLENGTIPDDFMRIMFYTFGDFKDLCLGNDIGSHPDTIGISATVNGILNKHKNGSTQLTAETWWNKNAKDIWKGMVCALEKAGGNKDKFTGSQSKYQYNSVKFSDNTTTLEDFAKRPQFLRWFTEWGEHFCREQSLAYKDLVQGCNGYECNGENRKKHQCENACKVYKEFIEKWKVYYNSQSAKFKNDKAANKYKDDPAATEAHNASTARDYLKTQLKKLCSNDDWKCMEKMPTQQSTAQSSDNSDIPASLYYPPDGYANKCDCKDEKELKTEAQSTIPIVPQKQDDACTIVDKLFEEEKKNYFAHACSQKYKNGKEKHTQWKCTNKTKNGEKGQKGQDDEVCIPPRRQKMYVAPLQNASVTTQVELRKAFIQAAAVETFFQWHKYKKEKEKEDKEQHAEELRYTSHVPNELNDEIKKGIIPEDFKSQMFYTLGDYRDILFGKDITGDTNIKTINVKIEEILPKNGTADGKKPNEKREEFWTNHGKDIWKGMVCALTYNTDSGGKDKKIEKVTTADNKDLFENDYENASYGGAIGQLTSDASRNAAQDTKLKDFVKTPTYFRWLEEWGKEFCGERKRRLKVVKKECVKNDGSCSGDGEHCKEILNQDYTILPSFKCPGCGKSCRFYKKWIKEKRAEYENQEKKYETENKAAKRNKDRNEFSTKVEAWPNAAAFLKTLGSCSKKDNDDSEIGEDNIDFDQKDKTFGPAQNCKPCPKFKKNCQNGHCVGSGKKANCNGKTFKVPDDIKNEGIFTEKVYMYVGDDSTNGFNGLEDCKNAHIFKGIKKEEWKCGEYCGVDICEQTNVNVKENDKEYIQIRALLKRWVENFLEDYNKIKHKTSHCTNNEKKSTCTNDCPNKCKCVRKWIEKKKNEWEEIKKRYLKQYKSEDEDNYKMKHFLESLQSQLDFKKATGHKELTAFEDSEDCNGGSNSGKKKVDEKDIVQCLLENLDTKIKTCPSSTSGKPQAPCVNHSPSDDETLDSYEEDIPDHGQQSPKFCPKDVEDAKEPETDSDILCDDIKQPKCDGFKTYNTNTYKPKKNLIGLEAHFYKGGIDYQNVYISPRVKQLCLQPLKSLKDNTQKNALIEALKECAYNEAKGLYQYYSDNKNTLGNNDSPLSEKEITTYILEAMKRSYADYGNIVKGDIWWNYDNDSNINEIILSIAKTHNQSQNTSSIEDDAKRLQLWESIRNDVWKAMICGYKSAGGSMKNLPNVAEFCTLPSTDNENQFSRWFKEWGESFCIRREQELKQLKNKCQNGACNGSDEAKKKECKRLCEKYGQFLSNSKTQYEKQSSLYNELKESISEFENKDPFSFLKENCNSKFTCFKGTDENELNKIFHYPSDEVKTLCTRTSKNTSKTKPTNCIEEAAYELQQDVAKKIGNNSKNLKGNEIFLFDCRKGDHVVIDNSGVTKKIDKDKLEQFFPSNIYSCQSTETNGFHIEKEWDCNNRNINVREKHLCLPPRRKFMCIKKIDDMISSTVDDKNKLLEVIMEAAKTEGVRILKNYQEQNKTDFSEICHDMKYSFADLGDIIRGRDLWRSNVEQQRIQQKLKTIFRYINDDLVKQNVKKYQNDGGNYYTLRSDWWDANRKSIWKAMTCSAPRNAYIYKNTNTGENIRSTDMYYYCGYTKEPPYVDYIPQKLRWMTEWSEYFCKTLNKKLETFKTVCDECIQSKKKCHDNNKGSKCQKCKEECEKYKDFVNKWKLQYGLQSKAYEELYDKANKNTKIYVTNDDNFAVHFLKQAKEKCGNDDPSTSEKYLYKTSNCKQYKFNDESTHSNKIYAFRERPEGYESKCTCEITQHPLDDCPDNTNKEICNTFQVINRCNKENFNNDLDKWNSYHVEDSKGKNAGVLVPPRRRHLCLNNTITKLPSMRHKEDFKKEFLNSVYTESKLLWDKYNKNSNDVMKAMKYSFADYADIIKGIDILDTTTSKDINKRLLELLNISNNDRRHTTLWWRKNKTHVWHAMLCGYKDSGGNLKENDCSLPDDETPQFLRWFQEWTETFCTERQKLYNVVNTQCNNVSCNNDTGNIDSKCTEACKNYSNFILLKKKVYKSLKKQYNDNYKSTKADNKEPHEYFNEKCKDDKCACLNEKLNIEDNWKKPYETLDDYELKKKCDCKKIVPPPPPPIPSLPPPADEPFNRDILEKIIPFGIALALGSIAFLFIKKKPKHPVDLLRVLDIHKGDYGVPTKLSSNRYIPYGTDRYKGKTYIYMEGDTSGDEKYSFMSDTTDITSSESEYEEFDINDIYPYQSPKYKTLIEVVLEPSKRDTQSDDIPSDNTHTNKPINDEEWNELKQHFISGILENAQKDLPKNNISANTPMNTQPNTLYFDKPEEKPFITSIHDRNLYTGEEYSYNINMSTNTMDDTKYVSNNVYSGIDLINDSLSGNKHIEIYDEVLKRKENELFGTKHPKRTTTNHFAKLTNSDPIMNQINLFDKWLDRHRDMCENWENHDERLAKLKEEWNKDNNSGENNINEMLNTNVSIEIDMDNPKPINQFSNMDTNVDTPTMDNMEDDIYYDVNDDDDNQPSVEDIPMDHNRVDVPKKVHVEMKILNNISNGSLEQQFPISDVWNI
ncbi:erythrocyte membrane protein 1, PfEMP1 [Plasmodium reichenowi]|uniref:Erythrocyte membrane protein 1, PfEMP1 n=1 Tax=Plasmodium reichenowi TaxID=5854 RepID=A0A2P9DSP9_PLARE|nr:erythrocyte membrane protein 1, PfEMP1 [Plasmodium reichenowi]